MATRRIEHERPNEWLRSLAEDPEAYAALVAEAGGLTRAAYRVASARCRAQGTETPTLRELQAAALMLAQRLGVVESLPISSLLASDCEDQGLLVIRPMPTPPSSCHSSIKPLRRAS